MKINDEGTSNAAHWYERAMKAESRLAEIIGYCAQEGHDGEPYDTINAIAAGEYSTRGGRTLMNVKMLEDAKYLQILTLLDDVEQSMNSSMKAARHKQLWDEDEVPVEAWQGDIQTVMKLLDGHL